MPDMKKTPFELSDEAGRIAAAAAARGVTRLVHFTPFNNLLGIVGMNGVWARERIRRYAAEKADQFLLDYITSNDPERYDRRPDCVNLSVEHVNARLFRRFRDNFGGCDLWAVLEIDPCCLLKKGVTFTVGNAASGHVRSHGAGCGAAAFEALFAPCVTVGNRHGVRRVERPDCLRAAYPTDAQAEVLFPEEIPLPIVLESESDRARVKSALEMDSPGVRLPELKVCPSDFTERKVA